MRPQLAALLALPAAAFAADAGLPPAQQALFDTERAFVRLADEKGFRDAFYTFFADNGIAFNPHPFRVRAALAGAPPSPGPMGAVWAPVYGDVSAAGDLGWNTGPLIFLGQAGAPDRHGMFFSVWKRQADGNYRVVLDIGGDTPGPVVPIDEPAHSSWTGSAVSPADPAAAKAAVVAAEEALLAAATAGGPAAAYAGRAGDGARLHRPGALPVVGAAALAAWWQGQTQPMRGELLFTDVADSADLAYTWGNYETAGDAPAAGYFARVWKRGGDGDWRIVFDTVSPVPAGVRPLSADLMAAEAPFLEGRWPDAESAYRRIVDADPGNAFAWNRLGTAQIAQKKHVEAAASLERAIDIGGGTGLDHYNLACAYAQAGQADRALDSVERAIGAGFRRRAQYESDPDLAPLRDLPRFRALVAPLD